MKLCDIIKGISACSMYSRQIFYRLSPLSAPRQFSLRPDVPLDCKRLSQCHSFHLLLCVRLSWCHRVEKSNKASLPGCRAIILISLEQISAGVEKNWGILLYIKYIWSSEFTLWTAGELIYGITKYSSQCFQPGWDFGLGNLVSIEKLRCTMPRGAFCSAGTQVENHWLRLIPDDYQCIVTEKQWPKIGFDERAQT